MISTMSRKVEQEGDLDLVKSKAALLELLRKIMLGKQAHQKCLPTDQRPAPLVSKVFKYRRAEYFTRVVFESNGHLLPQDAEEGCEFLDQVGVDFVR